MPLLLAAAAFAAPSAAEPVGARQRALIVVPDEPAARKGEDDLGYSDAVVAGDTVYLSGIVAGLREGETLDQAYARAFERIGGVLRKAGAGFDDIVEMTTFHTDVTAQIAAFAAAKKRYLRAPHPAWTAIGVTRLLPNTGITEIRIVAHLGGSAKPSR